MRVGSPAERLSCWRSVCSGGLAWTSPGALPFPLSRAALKELSTRCYTVFLAFPPRRATPRSHFPSQTPRQSPRSSGKPCYVCGFRHAVSQQRAEQPPSQCVCDALSPSGIAVTPTPLDCFPRAAGDRVAAGGRVTSRH